MPRVVADVPYICLSSCGRTHLVRSTRVPQQARGLERREQILRATLAVVANQGIGAVTHRAVAEEAEVPLGTLTYWFAAKDDLLREALLLFVEEETARLRRVETSLEGDLEPAEIADRFAEALEAGDDGASVAQFELYLEATRNPAVREAAERCFAAYDDIVRAALRAAGVGELAPQAALFVSLADGLGLRRLATGTGPDLREALVVLFAGLSGR